MSPMKPPLILRLSLAWAALSGTYVQISMTSEARGIQYRFDLEDRAVRRWIARREKRRAREQAARAKREAKLGGAR